MDYCECLTNSALGKSLLDFIKKHTRQYCTGNECPLDGTPGNGQSGNTTGPNPAFLAGILFLLMLSILMSALNDKKKRQRLEDERSEKVRVNGNRFGGDGDNDGPPPAVN